MADQVLTAAQLGAAMEAFAQALEAHREVINRLNVYPVPDGDTGTNMALTARSVCEEVGALGPEPDMAETCQAVAHGSLMGARGNSGVILSQVLRGACEVLRASPAVDGPALATALSAGATAAYGAVMRPVEGTILTVVRESAEAAGARAVAHGSLVEVLDAARAAGGESLARTPELLDVLARAGVVDAGGTGFLLLLDALLHVTDGRPLPEPPAPRRSGDPLPGGAAAPGHDGGEGDLRYEVMYLLDAPDEAMGAFKDVWATLGDSIVVVGGEGLWNCHIHTDDIGASIEAALDVGRPRSIRVTDLHEQVEEERWVREAEPLPATPAAAHQPVPCAVVAVAVGDGTRRIFHSLGVQEVVTGGQTMNPSTAQLLEAVERAPAGEVVLLPNNKNVVAVAEQVGGQTAKVVRVVPTHGVVEGFAALVAYDPQAGAEANAVAMGEAAGAVVAGEVTTAVRDATCDLGPIAAGDHLGVGRDGIVAVGASVEEVATRLLDHLVGEDHELVTVIEGEGATPAATRNLEVWLAEHRPGAVAEVHHGGQPLYPYLFGVE